MTRKSNVYEFNITVNPQKKENEDEYDLRIAKATAQVLMELLSKEDIDELIKTYKKLNNSD